MSKSIYIIIFILIIPFNVYAKGYFWTDSATGFAIGGFDPITYYTENNPRQGNKYYEWQWHGVTWRFVNYGNMEAFKQDPRVYAPMFGGHGAFILTKGKITQGNPRIWKIVSGKLYLFFSLNNKKKWLSKINKNISFGEKNWNKIINEDYAKNNS